MAIIRTTITIDEDVKKLAALKAKELGLRGGLSELIENLLKKATK